MTFMMLTMMRMVLQGGGRPLCCDQGIVWVRVAWAVSQTGQSSIHVHHDDFLGNSGQLMFVFFSRWRRRRREPGRELLAIHKPPESSRAQYLVQPISILTNIYSSQYLCQYLVRLPKLHKSSHVTISNIFVFVNLYLESISRPSVENPQKWM